MFLRATLVVPIFLLFTFQSPQDSIRKHYDAAETQRRAGNLAAAETEYVAILAEGYRNLGRINSTQKEYTKATAALEAAALYSSDSEAVLIDLAIAYFEAEQYDKALEAARKALAKNPQSIGAHHIAGKSYFMVGDFTRSAGELEAALTLAPNDHDVAYTLGLVFLKQHELDPAKKIYDRMVEQLGERPQLHIIFGRAYRETDYLPEAIEEFRKALAIDPHFPRAHYYLGLTYLLKYGVVKIDEAAEEFKVELISNPDEFFANYYLGIVYVIKRNWELAISFLQKAARIQPDNPDPYFYLGQSYQAMEKHDQAIEVLKKAISLNPGLGHNDYQVATAHYRLGQSLVKTGQKDLGEKELQIASQLKAKSLVRDQEKIGSYLNVADLRVRTNKFPELASFEGIVAESNALDEKAKADLQRGEAYYAKVVASAHENVALLRAQRQDFRAAADQFALAAKWNPQLDELNFNWGLAAFKANSYKEAIPPLENELKAHPTRMDAKQLLGLSYFMVDNYERASELLSLVVAAKPNEAPIYYPLAISLVKQGKIDDAQRVIQQMIIIGGHSPQVHIVISQAYYEQGQTTKALEELKTALSLDGKTLLAHYYSGQILLKMGKFEEAAQEFENELAISPNDLRAKYHLAFVLLAAQKTERGIKLMKEVIQLKPDYAEAHYELGKVLLQQGDIKGAVENLEAAARLKPDESYVHYQLGRAYLAAGRKAEGESQLEISKQLKAKERSQTTP